METLIIQIKHFDKLYIHIQCNECCFGNNQGLAIIDCNQSTTKATNSSNRRFFLPNSNWSGITLEMEFLSGKLNMQNNILKVQLF